VVELGLDEVISRGLEMTLTFDQAEDYDALWEHFEQVKRYGREGLDAALQLLQGDTLERTVGCDLLSVLCNPDDQGWGHEVALAVCKIAQDETDADCCWSIAQALEYAGDPIGVPVLVRLADHPDSDVRFKVASALPCCVEYGALVDPSIVDSLLRLMEDNDANVRDWATFGLGQQLEVDSPTIRDSFIRHLNDDHDDTRFEALLGLARRRDRRALAAVKAALEADAVFRLAVVSARYLSNPELLPSLLPLTAWWDADPVLLRQAIGSCDPNLQSDRLSVLKELLEDVVLNAGASISARCDLYDEGVSIEAQTSDGRVLLWTLEELIDRSEGNGTICDLVLSEIALA
jgi:hypothetical protein